MRRKEIERKFDEFVDSSGVVKFLDTPVKPYPSDPILGTVCPRLEWKIEKTS